MRILLMLLLVVEALPALGTTTKEETVKKYQVEVSVDVQYTQGDEAPQVMDIMRPAVPVKEPMPALVWIHGGGWCTGEHKSGYGRMGPYAEKGYVCATISYRLSPAFTFPAQIEDCKCAIRYLRAHAREYNIDPKRIGVWGDSAGGHLVALLGTSGGVAELEGNRGWAGFPSNVQAVCDFFGPTDIEKMGHLKPEVPNFLGGPLEENLEKAKKASPVTYVTKDDPPFLILQGKKDVPVPFEQSVILKEALEKAGVQVELMLFEDAGHGGEDFDKKETCDKIMEFFDEHLGRSKPDADGDAGK